MAVTAEDVMNSDVPAYGLWFLVVVNAGIFILIAFSFFKPKTARDWRTLGAFSAFIVALFVEMYDFPLTLYLLAGWLGTRFPALDPMSHDAGHLWPAIFGWSMNPHWSPFHLLSFVFIGGGFILIATAWRVLHEAQREGRLATTGPLCASAPSSVRWLCTDHDRLFPAMADAGHGPDAACPARHVLAPCQARRARGRSGFRRGVPQLRWPRSGLHPSSFPNRRGCRVKLA